jgi:hypothetical protein
VIAALAARWRILAAQLPGGQAGMEEARAQWHDMLTGGAIFAGPLPGARQARLLLQPDGDVVLSLPRDFGAMPGDAAGLDALVTGLPARLDAMWQAARSGRLGAAVVLAEAALAALAIVVPAHEAWAVLQWARGTGGFPWQGMAWSAAAAALPWVLRGTLRLARAWVLRRIARA